MSSFLSSQSRLRRGKWTAEEEMYAACIMEAFKEGSLNDVAEGVSLRGYLAEKLRTNVKRISKKYEGTNYNGKRVYLEKTNLPESVVTARRSKLKELEYKFEKSVKLMEDAESAKKDMARLNSPRSLMSSFPPRYSTIASGLQAPSSFPPNSLAVQAGFVSRDVMEENLMILARQSAANSIQATRRSLTGLGSSLSMASFGSLSNLELQALMTPPSPRTVASAGLPLSLPPSLAIPASLSETRLQQMILQQQHDAITAEIAARQEADAVSTQLLHSVGAATRALEQRAPSPVGSRLALKRAPQLQDFVGSPTKRAKLF